MDLSGLQRIQIEIHCQIQLFFLNPRTIFFRDRKRVWNHSWASLRQTENETISIFDLCTRDFHVYFINQWM